VISLGSFRSASSYSHERKLFKNGRVLASDTPSYTFSINGPVYIGGGVNGHGLTGSLDELRCWSRTLSDDELTATFKNHFDTYQQLFYFPFDISSSLEDASGQGFTLTATGTIVYESLPASLCLSIDTSPTVPRPNPNPGSGPDTSDSNSSSSVDSSTIVFAVVFPICAIVFIIFIVVLIRRVRARESAMKELSAYTMNHGTNMSQIRPPPVPSNFHSHHQPPPIPSNFHSNSDPELQNNPVYGRYNNRV
jgi:hypothetical protein